MIKFKHNRSLGELEAEIMEVIWKLKSASVRQVLDRLSQKRKIAYTTVMTVMSRLVGKGVLKRQFDENNAYIYSPTKDKENFLADASKQAINRLIREFGEVAVAQFIDAVESSDSKKFREWQKKLQKIK